MPQSSRALQTEYIHTSCLARTISCMVSIGYTSHIKLLIAHKTAFLCVRVCVFVCVFVCASVGACVCLCVSVSERMFSVSITTSE